MKTAAYTTGAVAGEFTENVEDNFVDVDFLFAHRDAGMR